MNNPPIENLDWKKLGQSKKFWSVLTMLILVTPIGIIWMMINPTYYRKNGDILRMSRKSKFLLGAPFVAFMGYILIILLVPGASISCDNSTVVKTVHRIFSENENFKKMKAEIKAITNIEETGYDASKDIHLCHAKILAKIGDETETDEINYTVKVTKNLGSNIEFLVELN